MADEPQPDGWDSAFKNRASMRHLRRSRPDIVAGLTGKVTTQADLEEKLQQLLLVYDFGRGPVEQGPDFLANAPQHDRYRTFTWTAEGGDAKLQIRPPTGQKPLELPQWLDKPFLIRAQSKDLSIKPERSKQPVEPIGPGAKLIPDRQRVEEYGSLGVIMADRMKPKPRMASENFRPQLLQLPNGLVMTRREMVELKYYALTAGHVIPTFNRYVFAQREDGHRFRLENPGYDTAMEALSNDGTNSTSGEPNDSSQQQQALTMADLDHECGFLRISPHDILNFSVSLYNEKWHYFNRDLNGQPRDGNPLRVIRRHYLEQEIRNWQRNGFPGFEVRKSGATTGLTKGYLVEVRDRPPEDLAASTREEFSGSPHCGYDTGANFMNEEIIFGDETTEEDTGGDGQSQGCTVDSDWEDSAREDDGERMAFDGQSSSISDVLEDEWLGVVQWAAHTPFAAGGDSGSLVYAQRGRSKVPLGIHIGASDTPFRSYFISLETFCYVAEERGLGQMCFPRYGDNPRFRTVNARTTKSARRKRSQRAKMKGHKSFKDWRDKKLRDLHAVTNTAKDTVQGS